MVFGQTPARGLPRPPTPTLRAISSSLAPASAASRMCARLSRRAACLPPLSSAVNWSRRRRQARERDEESEAQRDSGGRRLHHRNLGKVGAVAAREVSRFARNSRDWQQLIEMCRVVDTVLIDQETVYAPRQGNDRRQYEGRSRQNHNGCCSCRGARGPSCKTSAQICRRDIQGSSAMTSFLSQP